MPAAACISNFATSMRSSGVDPSIKALACSWALSGFSDRGDGDRGSDCDEEAERLAATSLCAAEKCCASAAKSY